MRLVKSTSWFFCGCVCVCIRCFYHTNKERKKHNFIGGIMINFIIRIILYGPTSPASWTDPLCLNVRQYFVKDFLHFFVQISWFFKASKLKLIHNGSVKVNSNLSISLINNLLIWQSIQLVKSYKIFGKSFNLLIYLGL